MEKNKQDAIMSKTLNSKVAAQQFAKNIKIWRSRTDLLSKSD